MVECPECGDQNAWHEIKDGYVETHCPIEGIVDVQILNSNDPFSGSDASW